MKRYAIILLVVATLLLVNSRGNAQKDETKKFEAGAQFSLLNIDRVSGRVTEPGVGGRFTYNLTDNLALEAEMNFFPRTHNGNASNEDGGRITEGLFGLKAGKRFEKFGLFGKFRPGFTSFGRAITGPRDARVFINNPTLFSFQYGRITHFATDVGGVLEFYPSKRMVFRFDLGDTIIRYGHQTFIDINGQSVTSEVFTRHNLQFGAGVSFRF